jgi:hypothetical protein
MVVWYGFDNTQGGFHFYLVTNHGHPYRSHVFAGTTSGVNALNIDSYKNDRS